jgi:hypothetical protein
MIIWIPRTPAQTSSIYSGAQQEIILKWSQAKKAKHEFVKNKEVLDIESPTFCCHRGQGIQASFR